MYKYAFLVLAILAQSAIASVNGVDIYGNLNKSGKAIHLTVSDLIKDKNISFVTSTNFTKKEKFTGVPVEYVINKYGLKGSYLHVTCLDGYSYKLDINELIKYGAIFAYKRNDKIMSLKDLGPVAIIFPRDAYGSKLGTADINAKTMWQISKIEVI